MVTSIPIQSSAWRQLILLHDRYKDNWSRGDTYTMSGPLHAASRMRQINSVGSLHTTRSLLQDQRKTYTEQGASYQLQRAAGCVAVRRTSIRCSTMVTGGGDIHVDGAHGWLQREAKCAGDRPSSDKAPTHGHLTYRTWCVVRLGRVVHIDMYQQGSNCMVLA